MAHKILIVASLRYPIAEPFAGGLEAHTAVLAAGLRARGHSVLVAGAVGSDPSMVGHVFGAMPASRPGERADTMENDAVKAAEHSAFTRLVDDLHAGMLGSFDLIHNNSLYPFLVQRAGHLPHPVVTTLHTPPLPWAERVLTEPPADQDPHRNFVAVSSATARSWHPLLRPRVVLNGIDTSMWPPGPGGEDAVWSGRIVREKGPHLAIEMARAAGRGLTIAGPIIDRPYFDAAIAPHLGPGVRYAGHLSQRRLATLVGRSALALVTPTWEEPFGMVVAEAMACGTPVVAFARGGIPEILGDRSGRLLPPAGAEVLTAAELARAWAAIDEAVALDRTDVRREAIRRCGRSAMLDGYEDVYRDLVDRWVLR